MYVNILAVATSHPHILVFFFPFKALKSDPNPVFQATPPSVIQLS